MSNPKHTPGELSLIAIDGGASLEIVAELLDGNIVNIAEVIGAGTFKMDDGPEYTVTKEEAKANARRLAACWNACEGIETGMLEGFSPRFLAGLPDRACSERLELTKQRDELVTLLKELIDMEGPQPGSAQWADKVRAAIAEAKGGAA